MQPSKLILPKNKKGYNLIIYYFLLKKLIIAVIPTPGLGHLLYIFY